MQNNELIKIGIELPNGFHEHMMTMAGDAGVPMRSGWVIAAMLLAELDSEKRIRLMRICSLALKSYREEIAKAGPAKMRDALREVAAQFSEF